MVRFEVLRIVGISSLTLCYKGYNLSAMFFTHNISFQKSNDKVTQSSCVTSNTLFPNPEFLLNYITDVNKL